VLSDLEHDVIGGTFVDNKSFHLLIEQLARNANVDCCFNFVTSKDPDLNSSLFHEFNRVGYLVLELVLNGSGANEVEIMFDLFRDLGHTLFSVVGGYKGLLIF
jgi:hypothetical protein